jgi:hypothetical protein
MENLWLKIKIWTKISILTIVVVYFALFLFRNGDQPVNIWFMFGHDPLRTSALTVIALAFLAGIIGTVVFRMAYRAIRQIKDLRAKSAAAKMGKDVEQLKAKAGMLQTKPETSTDTVS